jgi:hypothetical protein
MANGIPLLYLKGEHHGVAEEFFGIVESISKNHSFLLDKAVIVAQNGSSDLNLVTIVVQDLPTMAWPCEDLSYLGKSDKAELLYRGFNFFKNLQNDASTPSRYGTLVQPRYGGDIGRITMGEKAPSEKIIAMAEIVSFQLKDTALDAVVLYDHERQLTHAIAKAPAFNAHNLYKQPS